MPEFPSIAGGFLTDVSSVPANSTGTSVSTSATAHTKGSWTQLFAATTSNTSWIAITLFGLGVTSYLVDIGVGAAASEQVVIPNLFFENVQSAAQSDTRTYLFPLYIRAGTRVVARAQSAAGVASTCLTTVHLIGSGIIASSPLGRVEACGPNTATTRLVAVEPGGVAHTDSSMTSLVTTTSFPYKWLNITFGHGASTSGTDQHCLVDIGWVGGFGEEYTVVNDLFVRNHSLVDSISTVFRIPCSIPAGVVPHVKFRSSNTTATNRINDIGIWGCG